MCLKLVEDMWNFRQIEVDFKEEENANIKEVYIVEGRERNGEKKMKSALSMGDRVIVQCEGLGGVPKHKKSSD